MHSGVSVSVSTADRRRLETIVAGRNTPQKHVWRARVILPTAEGLGTTAIMAATMIESGGFCEVANGISGVLWRDLIEAGLSEPADGRGAMGIVFPSEWTGTGLGSSAG